MIAKGKNISHRFNYEGKAYNDRFISNRASGAAEKIARETWMSGCVITMNLVPIVGRR